MASDGPNAPGTTGDDATVGTVTWSSTSNIAASDDTYAQASLGSARLTSHYLTATSFGLAVPVGATVDGIVVDIERKRAGGSIRDAYLRIIKGGSIGSTDRANTGETWPSSDASASYGGTTDLWGESWTAADINAATFGVALAVTNATIVAVANVDLITVTVYYTESGGTNVTAVCATATADALVPTWTGGGTVTAVIGAAVAAALVPAVSAGGGVQVNAVICAATADALAPTWTGGGTVTAVCGEATADALVPDVTVIPAGEPVCARAVVVGHFAPRWVATVVVGSDGPGLPLGVMNGSWL